MQGVRPTFIETVTLMTVSNPPKPDEAPGGNETILVVEDDPDCLRITSIWLRNFGYNVLEAANGTEALRVADGHNGPIHLLLADIIMPRMTGGQLAEQIRRRRPETRLLFMSGYANTDMPVQFGTLSRAPLLMKPFQISALLYKVRETLEESDELVQ